MLPNNYEIFKILLEYNSDVNIRDWNGHTCLMNMCYGDLREEKQIELLLDYDCDVNITNYKSGVNTLMIFCIHTKNNTRLAKILKEKTNINHKNFLGEKVHQICLNEYKNLFNKR